MKLGSFLAVFGYVMVLVGIILLFLATVLPDLNDGVRYRIIAAVAIIALVFLPKVIPVLPRVLRLGMIGAWALVLIGGGNYRQYLDMENGPVGIGTSRECLAIEIQARMPPAELYVDSFAFAIENDLSVMKPDSYLDLIYTAVIVYSAYNPNWPSDVSTALRALDLEGSAYERFGNEFGRYRIRAGEDRAFVDTWFCGLDLECDTCDDRKAFYPWPKNSG